MAAGWLFYWVISTVASEVEDPELVGALTEIGDANLGYLALDELTDDQQTQFRTATTRLPGIAAATWRDWEGRESAMELLSRLVDMVGN